MRAASERFAGAVRDSHRARLRVESWRGTELLAESIPVEDGTLVVDGEQPIPGELRIVVPAGIRRQWIPTDPLHPLAPFGQRLYVERGIEYLDGDTEYLGLGWFLITGAAPDPLGQGTQVTAQSLERLLADDRIATPIQPKAGATLFSEVERLVSGRLPVDELPAALTNRTVPADVTWEQDRLNALGTILAAWPARARVNDEGLLELLAPVPEWHNIGPAVHQLATGERGVVAEWSSDVEREQLYNGVFVSGREAVSDKKQVRGYAWDSDETSPTYYLGPFGRRAFEYASPLLTTVAQCNAAAATMLSKRLRRTRVAVVSMVPDPRLELDDVVEVATPTVEGIGRVSGVALPLRPDGGPATVTLEMGP